MISAILSYDEMKRYERCNQRRFGFSFLAAGALHLALFIAFISFSFHSESPQLMMPDSQAIKAKLVITPKPAVQPKPVQEPARLQKAKPAQVQKHKAMIKKLATANPKPEPELESEPELKTASLPAPQPESEPFQAAEETQQLLDTVDELIEQTKPHEVSIDKESYVPASSNVAYYHNPKPRYPSAAKRRGMEGLVELRVVVDSHGQPVSVEVNQSSGFQLLDREAIKAIRQWRFQPATRAGIAVAGEVLVPVHYRLNAV